MTNNCIFAASANCSHLIDKVAAVSQSQSGGPFSRGALFMRYPGFGSNEAPALNAAGTVILRAHFANRQAFFADFPADGFRAIGDELRCRRGKGLRHCPYARIRCRNWSVGRGRWCCGWLRDCLRSGLRSSFHCRRLRRSDHLSAAAAHATGRNIDGPKQISPVLGHRSIARQRWR